MPPPTAAHEGPLLEILFASFPELKKTRIRQLLRFGSVTVNGRIETSHRHPVRPGDTLEILSKAAASRESLKRSLPFRILHEDTEIVVIDKPAGLLSMGTDRDKTHTAYHALGGYLRAQDPRRRAHALIVHRLDRDVSGLLLFAKNAKSQHALQRDWSLAVKKYFAVVRGVPRESSGEIRSYLMEDAFKRVYSTHERARGARHAVTQYRVLSVSGPEALLEVTLLTGRKNQIRVHLADLGHPILGDQKYGGGSAPSGRVYLHACFLSFRHPGTGVIQAFKSPLPEEFSRPPGHPAGPHRP